MATTHHKSFATVEDQISILKNEKGIVISDEDRAKEILRRVGYFPLISGYKTN